MNGGKDLFGLLLLEALFIFVANVAVLDHTPIRPASIAVYGQGSNWSLLHVFLV
jgi:hypothetical protein